MPFLITYIESTTDFQLLSNSSIDDFKGGFGFKGFSIPELTNRQKEIMEYAIKRGYYDSPKKISGKDIAKELNIAYSTFYEHIRKVERKSIKHLYGKKSL